MENFIFCVVSVGLSGYLISITVIRILLSGELLIPGFFEKKKSGTDRNLPKLKNNIMSVYRN